MARLGPLVLLFGLLARCGGGPVVNTGPPHIAPLLVHRMHARHVVLASGAHRTFRPGLLRPGDTVGCFTHSGGNVSVRIPNRPYGTAWSVGKETATPAGKSSGLELQSSADGSVTATCR
jgi:hypothetical protein